DQSPAAGEWFDQECDNLVAAVAEANARGWHVQSWQLAYVLRVFFRARHMIDQWHATHRLALRSATKLNAPDAQARLYESLSEAYALENHHQDAWDTARAALRLYHEADDPIGIGRSNEMLGNTADLLGDPHGAEAHYTQALSVPEYANDAYYSMTLRLNLGAFYGRQGRFAEARELFTPVLSTAVAQANWDLACVAHHNIAIACCRLHAYAEGEFHAGEEIRIAEHHGFTLRAARGWEILGDVFASQRKPDAADALSRALDLYTQLDHPQASVVRNDLKCL
ncbi:MAG TPA: tetratricopeptide repeat protein, partial [Micromonosporaceae bacterium]